jgi:hypothetical protein
MSSATNYSATLDYLRSKDLELDEQPSENIVSYPVGTDGGEFRVFARAPEGSEQVVVHSVLDFAVPAARREEVATFLTNVNYGLSIGNFEIDLTDGELRYKTSIDLGGAPLMTQLLDPLFGLNMTTMHRYLPGIAAVVAGLDAASAIETLDNG